jgi:hypothetical protein
VVVTARKQKGREDQPDRGVAEVGGDKKISGPKIHVEEGADSPTQNFNPLSS